MAKTKKKKPPAQRRDAHDTPREVDSFKRLHVAIAIAPVFVRGWFEDDKWNKTAVREDVAELIVGWATAIARKL